jgi:hypothetical protein
MLAAPSLGNVSAGQVAFLSLADTVAVVRRGVLVRPVALRLDAGCGRWVVTELRWWRNETDTATTPGRDDGSS